MPIPQELFFLVGWASCPSNKFMKGTFARGLRISGGSASIVWAEAEQE